MQETRNWTQFEIGSRTPHRSYMHASVNKRGKIQLNTFVMQTLDYPDAVLLFYDRETMSIGIKPAKLATPNTLPVIQREERNYGEIYALSFLNCYNIRITRTLATNRVDLDDNGILVIDLRHAYEVVRKNKADG